MSSGSWIGGWAGPGAKSSPRNQGEEDQYKILKHKLQAEEKAKREAENERRVSVGQKPLKDSAWTKTKAQFKRMMM